MSNDPSPLPVRTDPGLWLAAAFLLLLGLVGGSARADVPGLLVLRPLAVLLAGWAVWQLTPGEWRRWQALVWLAGLTLLLPLAQLVPLPPALWRGLPQGALLEALDAAAGLGPVWRPLSLDPVMTRNALWALSVPVAMLALAVRLDARGHRALLGLVLGLGLASGLLGLMQVAMGPGGPLRLYAITNPTSGVGLFANRNHQAVLLAALPLLMAARVALAGDPQRRRRELLAALVLGVLVVAPALLVTGSRAGLLLGLGALGLVPFVLGEASCGRPGLRHALLAGLVMVMLGLLALLLGQGDERALARLLGAVGEAEERRWDYWRIGLALILEGFPWGTGLGSFAGVFQIVEPVELLGPRYVNHLHNDWLQVVLEGGMAGLLLLAGWLWLAARAVLRLRFAPLRGEARVLGRAGAGVLLIAGLASLADYPLRTPLLLGVASLAMVWLGRAADCLHNGGACASMRSGRELIPRANTGAELGG